MYLCTVFGNKNQEHKNLSNKKLKKINMAALQEIRSHGPLLIGVIALGLFAFIAGDAWKVIAPRQSQDVGEVNGKNN